MPAPDATTAKKDEVREISITVVGIGNHFRGDDAVGMLTIKNLTKKVPSNVKAVELVGDQSYLLELMQSSDVMIVVDAVHSSAPAGTIFRIDASEESIPRDFFTFSTHGIDSMHAIELARSMKLLPKQVIIYGIVGKDFSYSPKLSPQIQESLEIVQNKILNDIDRILKNENCG